MAMTQERSKKSKTIPKRGAGGTLDGIDTTRSKGNGRAGEAACTDVGERESLVARIAYFRAEKRGFASGGEWQDWFEAEVEVEALLLNGSH